MTIHPSWIKAGGIALEIMEGKHDDDLDTIAQACKVRLKSMFRKNQKVKLVNTRNLDFEGAIGTVDKVHTKTVAVAVNGTVLNVPPHMLEAV